MRDWLQSLNALETIIRAARQNQKNKSRPQQNLWSFDLGLTCLLMLTVIFFILALYSILQANLVLLHIEPTLFWSLKILDTSSSASLFVTLVGALLVRHQFAVSVLPRINYKSERAIRRTQNPTEDFETWRVEIRNTGLGSAIITGTEYVLGFAHSKENCHSYRFGEIIQELTKRSLVRDCDYWLENISIGFSLSPKDDCFVFEIKMEHVEQFKSLMMMLYFQGQLGDRYCKEISLIPRV